LTILARVPALLRNEFHRMASIHAQALARMPNFHPRELGRVPDLHPGMSRGVPRAERRLVLETRVRRLLVLGDVSVGEQSVLGAVPDVQILMRRQMLPRHSGVVVDMSMFDVGVLGRVSAERDAG
jgi:hypothetical protein